MEVKWKLPVFNADAQKCYEEISTLSTITPESILAFAKNSESELHKCFEWDDVKAAEKYRLSQARKVIQLMVIRNTVEDNDLTPKRVFQISSEKSVYQPIKFFMENEKEYDILLKRALGELTAFKKRYSEIVELEEVMSAIDELLKRGA